MANKTNIRRLAKILSFTTLSKKTYELKELSVSNLDYLEFILGQEVEARRQNRVNRNRRFSNLLSLTFDTTILTDGLKYQEEKLSELKWIESGTNLLVTGICGKGKTAFATHLAGLALDSGFKVYYLTQDEALTLFSSSTDIHGAKVARDRIQKADLVIIDDFLYLTPSSEELKTIYKILLPLNLSASLVLISNRDISTWQGEATDKYTMQLLIDRILGQSETINLF